MSRVRIPAPETSPESKGGGDWVNKVATGLGGGGEKKKIKKKDLKMELGKKRKSTQGCHGQREEIKIERLGEDRPKWEKALLKGKSPFAAAS